MPTKPKTHDPIPAALRARMNQQREADKKRAAYKYDHTPERQADLAFYRSQRWVRFRNFAMKLPENVLCRACKEQGRIVPATDLDHIKPRKEHPELQFSIENVQGLCGSCHTRKTRKGG